MVSKQFYAWAVPAAASGSPVDHTWITTYDSRKTILSDVEQIAAAGEAYWFCWGVFHAVGGTPPNPSGFLGQQAGDLALTECLVKANVDSRSDPEARGTIFIYGRDGVCHQLANQVLHGTSASGRPPLTVVKARGYMASVFIYGAYGRQRAAWLKKIRSCTGPRSSTQPRSKGAKMSNPPDDFETKAREVLGADHPKLLAELLALRAKSHRSIAQARVGTTPDAEALNAGNQRILDRAAALLGPKKFEEIFGFPPGQGINLVDPAILSTLRDTVGFGAQARSGHAETPAKPVAGSTVTLKQIAAELAEHHEMSKRQTEAVLGDLVGLVAKHLKKGDRIRIGGLGILQVRKRAARTGRNPATGEPLQIKSSKKIAFRAAKELKEAV